MTAEPVRVAILDDYQQVAFTCADWAPVRDRLAIDVFTDTIADEDALVARLAPYEVICAMRERTPFPARLLDRLPALKLLTFTGQVNRAVDIAHAQKRGVVVCGTGFVMQEGRGRSTLEHIWAMVMGAARYLVVEDANIKAGNAQWQTVVPLGLSGRTLGLVGVGRLGSATAKIAKVFNMRTIGWSPHLTPERAQEAGVEFVATKDELFKQADIVSIHLVLSDSTRHIITANELTLMKPTSFFINTSRGPLVDTLALVEALQNGTIAGAALDVYETEPLPLDSPLRKLRNITLSPHDGYVSDIDYASFWGDTVANINAWLEGSPINLAKPL